MTVYADKNPIEGSLNSEFWTLDRIAEALSRFPIVGIEPREHRSIEFDHAFPRGPMPIRSISTDSRTLQPGDCFLALFGERFDGHDKIEEAIDKGAAAVIASKPPLLLPPSQNPPPGIYNLSNPAAVPFYIVDDTLVALGDLANFWRKVWGKTVVAIAGSNGKTSTKSMVEAALATVYDVHATKANFNNRVGVPLTLLGIHPATDIAVVEVGTSEKGEVAILRDIIEPDIAVITSIGEEHLEGLGSLEGVLEEEASICDGASLAIVPNGDRNLVQRVAALAERVITVGLEEQGDDEEVFPSGWSIRADGLGALEFDGVQITPQLRGVHNLQNALLALAVANESGIDTATAGVGIGAALQPPMRGVWQVIGTATVIDDTYNANPGSMKSALSLLAGTESSQRIAILGSMREMGADSSLYHDDIARFALDMDLAFVAGIGEMGEALLRISPNDPRIVAISNEDIDSLWARLVPHLKPDATFLVKASRGVQLERILPHIKTWALA